jgi:hypothetical protein
LFPKGLGVNILLAQVPKIEVPLPDIEQVIGDFFHTLIAVEVPHFRQAAAYAVSGLKSKAGQIPEEVRLTSNPDLI